nr:leucine-rich repeat extensin-like protein 2 [Oncorhynchus nerka]
MTHLPPEPPVRHQHCQYAISTASTPSAPPVRHLPTTSTPSAPPVCHLPTTSTPPAYHQYATCLPPAHHLPTTINSCPALSGRVELFSNTLHP